MNKGSNVLEYSEKEWKKISEKNPKVYRNCDTCGKRLVLTLCKYHEGKAYCWEHCPKHKWQSDYDWTTECGICGITYTKYLEKVLEQHKISFWKAKKE